MHEYLSRDKKRMAVLLSLLFLGVLLLTSAAKKEFAALTPSIFSDPNQDGNPQRDPRSAHLPSPPSLLAHAFFVRLAGEREPLLSQREWKLLPLASITKLLAALVAWERLEKDDVIVVSRHAKDIGEKQSGVEEGERFRRDDMLRLALIHSANDATYALAEAAGRKQGALAWEEAIGDFVNAMNSRARELDMRSSFFKNPAGLDESGHRATALDMALLAEYIMRSAPDIFSFSREREALVTSLDRGKEHWAFNTNPLLEEFPAIQGSKTGFTDEAGGTLVMLYPVRPDKTAIIVLLGSDDRFGDGRKIIQWLEKL